MLIINSDEQIFSIFKLNTSFLNFQILQILNSLIWIYFWQIKLQEIVSLYNMSKNYCQNSVNL